MKLGSLRAIPRPSAGELAPPTQKPSRLPTRHRARQTEEEREERPSWLTWLSSIFGNNTRAIGGSMIGALALPGIVGAAIGAHAEPAPPIEPAPETDRELIERFNAAQEPGALAPTAISPALRPIESIPTIPTRIPIHGVEIRTYGVSQPAIDGAVKILNGLLTNRPDIAENLKDRRAALVLIPALTKMTDLPEFKVLRGEHTPDGRVWDDVRGSGGTVLRDGTLAIGVGEETVALLASDGYPPGYSVVLHEVSHAIMDYGLPRSEYRAIVSAFEARKAAGGPWLTHYGSTNEREYWAEASQAYFRSNSLSEHNDPKWIYENDRPLYDLLFKAYGPAPLVPLVGAN